MITDFEYKDNRNYVHSSTQCSYVIEKCREIYKDNEPIIEMDASFHGYLFGNGELIIAEDLNLLNNIKSISEFKLKFNDRLIFAKIFDSSLPVSKRTKTNYDLNEIALTSDYCGVGTFRSKTLLSFFENVIEANKRVHQLTHKQIELKIANLYMKRIAIPQEFNDIDTIYEYSIINQSIRTHNKGITTLNQMEIKSSNYNCKASLCYLSLIRG